MKNVASATTIQHPKVLKNGVNDASQQFVTGIFSIIGRGMKDGFSFGALLL